jgi:mono/diheme cytochrome c family protein
MAGRLLSRVGSAVRWAPLLAVALTGCGEQGYPADLAYPLRSDLLVVKKPGHPGLFYPDPPGQLDALIARFGKDDELKDAQVLNPAELGADKFKENRQPLIRALRNRFGSPARPRVSVPDGFASEDYPLDQVRGVIRDLLLDEATLAEGSKLYRRHCLHCHGLSGDGRGPTGPWVNPHPRDYRQGKFKFISSGVAGRPTRDDLWRIIHNGIDGSTMPSFNTLTIEEIDRLVSYVIHLSVRGEVEYEAIKDVLEEKQLKSTAEALADQIADHVQYLTASVLVDDWGKAARSVLVPILPEADRMPEDDAKREESIRKGLQLFLSKGEPGGCSECHKDFGRAALFTYDIWGTLARANNLTAGVYRGGRRPIDHYWRIRAGIFPVAMSNVTKTGKEVDEDIWHLVNFVQALPYPRMLPADVRKKVYPSFE